ncbi:glycine-rich domain-containing protein-like [Xenorhabdus sp. SF857]|uniref:glycine-rich domain-containing protein n=1 Tax=Xenorhabdus bakwenae TaxID=3026967 RepID=UPI00255800E1|nr:glycine-rich domain-containing protein-like [Xenorhabdus sp. SF857]WFQ80996.1 glycine-rich domain-containing protein-like [Xenorhabdus sp. SF857]
MTKEEFFEKVKSVDFESIIKRITQENPNIARVWTEEGARDAVEQYKKFMFLIYKYNKEGRDLIPSIEIDEIWHHHILDTINYKKDCENIYGYFIHHSPSSGARVSAADALETFDERFMKTQQFYFEEFGEYMYEVDF